MENSKLFKSFLLSTLKVICISILGAICLSSFGINFWISFILFFIGQYILFSFIGDIIKHYFTEERRKKEIDKLEKLSTILECAYCKKQNLVTFDADDTERLEFVCAHCQNKNLVTMQFIVAQITKPLEMPKVDGISSFPEENS